MIKNHQLFFWWTRRDSNPRSLRCERSAFPAKLRAHIMYFVSPPRGFLTATRVFAARQSKILAGLAGFEPTG